MDHTLAIIAAFVVPARQQRCLNLLNSTKGRAKLRGDLAHFRDLDTRFARAIGGSRQTAEEIAKALTDLGAPTTCYVISEDASIDDRELPLDVALSHVVGSGMGTFISCLPGQLAYFEGEDAGERYILHRHG